MSAPPLDLADPRLRGEAPACDAPAVIHLPHPGSSPGQALPPPAGEKKRPKRQRPHVKRTRFSDDELAEFERQAQEAGLSEGAYTRLRTIGDAGERARRAPPTEASRLRAQHITAINRVGNLVNQGIRALHDTARRAPEAGDRDRLAEEIAATRELLESALPTLGEALAAVIAGDDREG